MLRLPIVKDRFVIPVARIPSSKTAEALVRLLISLQVATANLDKIATRFEFSREDCEPLVGGSKWIDA